ncbi:MAG: DUF1449 family protein [Chloroflexi bacterium]|nr:DUF1449 family protein [Chloroflexota bacterium]
MYLLEWWNLLFELPFFAGVLYVVLLATGVASAEGDGADADTDVDHGMDVDIDHDLDVDHDVDHGIDAVAHEVHADGHAEPSLLFKSLSFLGFGKIPLSILLTSFLLLWGFVGWASNQLLKDALATPALVAFSVATATLMSVFLVRSLARGLARVLPSTESYDVTRDQLVGRVAEVRYRITERAGAAQTYDQHGNLHEVDCRVDEGEPELPPGTRIYLAAFDREKGVFAVVPESQIGGQLPAPERR